jgi:hypothetical protein
VRLTPKEFELLRYLVAHAGKPVTHRELLQAVWGPDYGDEPEYLRVFINQVRKKIEPIRPSRLGVHQEHRAARAAEPGAGGGLVSVFSVFPSRPGDDGSSPAGLALESAWAGFAGGAASSSGLALPDSSPVLAVGSATGWFRRLGRFGRRREVLQLRLEAFAEVVGEDGVGQLGVRDDVENTLVGEPVGQILVHAARHRQQVYGMHAGQIRRARQRAGKRQQAQTSLHGFHHSNRLLKLGRGARAEKVCAAD